MCSVAIFIVKLMYSNNIRPTSEMPNEDKRLLETIQKEIICIDTCTLIGAVNKLEKLFPRENYSWSTTETIDLELNDRVGKSESDKRRRAYTFDLIINSEIKILLQPGTILQVEINKLLNDENFPSFFPFVCQSLQRKRFLLIQESNQESLQKMESRIKNQNEAKQVFWNNILFSENIINLDYKAIYKNYLKLNKNSILRVNEIVSYDVYKMLNNFSEEEFKKKCPANYNLIIFMAFFDILRKPIDAEKQFTATLNNERVVITPSTITDLKICYSILPYIDKFVTSDLQLCRLIEFLYPSYSNKIEIV